MGGRLFSKLLAAGADETSCLSLVWAALDRASRGWYVRDRAAGVTLNFEEPRERETEWVAEGLMMIRRTVFEELGGFDERFVMGYSGPDLCRRARLRGSEVRFSPSVQAEHLGVDSVGPKLRAAHRRASLALWYQKHHGVPWS